MKLVKQVLNQYLQKHGSWDLIFFSHFNTYKNFILFSAFLVLSSCSTEKDYQRIPGEPNALASETSPYLLQHAENPVNWFPWNEETIALAKRENKLIIVSIGYASCHWCHVMERESFMDDDIAKTMNDNFINIKVDREERPDIDQIYLNAIQLITGSGGWPLNAFALPDGKPFFAVTYLEPHRWKNLLERVLDMQENDYESIVTGAEQILKGISESEPISQLTIPSEFPEELLINWAELQLDKIDPINGGYTYMPKFFYAPGLEMLFDFAVLSENNSLIEIVHQSLWNIWSGGTYDHIGGGFSRYATEKEWKIPHFEKMLYDNALLLRLYAKAYKQSPNPIYETIINRTFEFLEEYLLSDYGLYFSSLDAESEKTEGLYYVWHMAEIQSLLTQDEFELFENTFHLTTNGNWSELNQNIIYLDKSKNEEILNANYEELKPVLKKLHQSRKNRISPKVDDKILTSWNALTISGLIHAYQAIGDERFKNRALKSVDFLLKKMVTDEAKIFRNYKDNRVSITGFLDDYSYLIAALIDLYQITFEEKWLEKAAELQEKAIELFYDEETQMFYYSYDPENTLVVRRYEVPDNVLPSPNGVCANNLLLLGDLYEDEEMISMAKQMMANVLENVEESGPFMASWARLYAYLSYGIRQVIVVGPESVSYKKELQLNHFPTAIYMGGQTEGTLPLMNNKLLEGTTTIYVCENRVCRLPVYEVADALDQLKLKDLTTILN